MSRFSNRPSIRPGGVEFRIYGADDGAEFAVGGVRRDKVGHAGLVKPIASSGVTMLDYGFMVAFSLLLLPLLYTGRVLHRVEGALLLALYGAYLWILWPK
jgi:hypothetical protein